MCQVLARARKESETLPKARMAALRLMCIEYCIGIVGKLERISNTVALSVTANAILFWKDMFEIKP
jgi:hypothetical protein|tara:strand:+ start:11666 stop:11863 length:198 start_codon:yes stop_codon:yes gene_type:complete